MAIEDAKMTAKIMEDIRARMVRDQKLKEKLVEVTTPPRDKHAASYLRRLGHMHRDSRCAGRCWQERMKLIMQNQESSVRDIETFLDEKKIADELARKDMLNLWTEQVYDRIEKQIAGQVEKIDGAELTKRLNRLSDTYIEAMKNKLIFRDVIIEAGLRAPCEIA